MTAPTASPLSLHASCVLIGEQGVLIRGPSGGGKSRLALRLMQQARMQNRFCALVSDDRTLITLGGEQTGRRLIARPHPRIAGILERRGTGLVKGPYAEAARLDLVIDLQPDLPPRLPDPEQQTLLLAGVRLLRISCAFGETDAAFAALGLDLWGETVIV